MSYQFANASGVSVQLHQGGNAVLQVPSGWCGPVALQGEVGVYVQSYTLNPTVGTNQPTPQTWTFYNLGAETVTWSAKSATLETMQSVNVIATGGESASWDVSGVGTIGFTLPTVHSGEIYHTGGGDYGFGNLVPLGLTTNYTTNFGPFVALGSYTGGEGVRLVVAGVVNVEAQTYAGHFEALGWGLALGVVVFGYRFVVDVIGSIGREQDL